MRMSIWLWPLVSVSTAFAMPALAAPECLANGQVFQKGQTACLTVAGKSHLARCDIVLNNTSWTKVQDTCPPTATDASGTPDKAPDAQPPAN